MPSVLLHPLGLDGASWRYLGLDAVAPDFAGHGARVSTPAMSLPAMAAEVAASLEEPADLVGISMGGVVAQVIALEWPQRVRSLVLACTTSASSPQTLQARAEAARSQTPEETADELIDRWFPGAGTPGLRARIDAAVRPPLLASSPEVKAACWEAIGTHQATERLREIDVPVTLIAGARDSPGPNERMGPMRERLARSRLIVLDCGHMPQISLPEELRAAIEAHRQWVREETTSL